MATVEIPRRGHSKSALLLLLFLSSSDCVVSGKAGSTSSGDDWSDSATGSIDRVHYASNSHRKLGWWYNFWVSINSAKKSVSPTKSPTPNPTKAPTGFPTKAPTSEPSEAPTSTISPTSCVEGPKQDVVVDFELALKPKDGGVLTSEEVARVKESTIQFLQDNVGGECTFFVQSLEIVDQKSAILQPLSYKEDEMDAATDDSNTSAAATTAFSIKATVSVKTSFIASLQKGLPQGGSNGSRRISNDDNICDEEEKLKCCISGAINDEKWRKCKKWGCTNEDCSTKDPNKNTASLFGTNENSYYGANFAEIISKIVPVDSVKSALGVTASDLASCSVTHDTIVILRDFIDFIERGVSRLYWLLPILDEEVVDACRNYTSLDCQEVEEIFCDGGSSESTYCTLPCNGVILPPTSIPTQKPTPKPTTSQGQVKSATYNDSVNAPRCVTVGRGCDSGVSLLNSRGFMPPAELHASNTIDGCRDGDAGTYHFDESIDRVTVTSVNGGLLTETTEALIEAAVWAYSKEADFADFWYAADAASPDWKFIATVQPATSASLNIVSTKYNLPVGRNQAVRVVFRFGGEAERCPGGSFDDVDDLVFAVGTGSPTLSPVPTLSPTITISPTASAHPSSAPMKSPTWSPTITLSPTISSYPTPSTSSPTLTPTNSTEQPTLSKLTPSISPSFSMVPTFSSRAPVTAATYDTALGTPKCSVIGSGSCRAAESLLRSRGNMNIAEPNASNTIDNCEDGNGGEYKVDESVESISVTSINGGPLVVGTEVRIDAVVWAWNKHADTVDFWHAPLGSSPMTNWVLIKSVKPTKSLSLNTVSTRYMLPYEGDNAVRVVMRYSEFPLACPGGDFDDVDDLVFVVGSGSGNGIVTATYDDTYKAPKCSSVGNACYAGPSLLNSRGTVGPGEPNAPNTIDQCEDGNEGTYLDDESIESIRVTSIDGGQFGKGKYVQIEARVWVYSVELDTADFWYAANANSPEWVKAGTANGLVSGQLNALSTKYYLPEGSLQAVRVVFRYGGTSVSCPGGSYDDVDDLVFVVGSG